MKKNRLLKSIAPDTAGGRMLMLSAVTLLVKAAGFLKQMIIAALFGTSGATDVFFTASDFFATLSAMLFSPLAIVFLTAYNRRAAQRGQKQADAFAVGVLAAFCLFSSGVAALLACFARPVARLLGFGFPKELMLRLAGLIRLFSPLVVFFCAAALLTALLQAQKQFYPAQWRGLVRSAAVIAAVLLFSRFGASALAAGFLAALPLETAYLLWKARKNLAGAAFGSWSKNAAEYKKLARAALPLMLSYAAAEVSHIVDKAIASRLRQGAVSALSYAQTLQGFAAALLVSNVGAVALSHFSEKSACGDNDGMLRQLGRSAKLLVLILLPVSIVSAAASPFLVRLAYARGSFDNAALTATAQAFSGYAAGLVGLSLQTVYMRGLYAQGDTGLPLKIGLWSVLLNLTLSWALSGLMGVGGIALASSASYYLGAAMSSKVLKGRKILPDARAVACAAFICAGGVALVGRLVDGSALIMCVLMGSVGFGGYFLTLLLFKEPDALLLVRMLSQKNSAKRI